MGRGGKCAITKMIEFNRDIWTLFDQDLSLMEIQYLENKARFLFDVVNREIAFMSVETDDSLESDLDLDFCIYMNYQNSSEKEARISPWMVHYSWLCYYINDKELDIGIKLKIKEIYENRDQKIRLNIIDIRDFLLLFNRIKKECDAVVWLSFLDFMVTMVLYKIQEKRIRKIVYDDV